MLRKVVPTLQPHRARKITALLRKWGKHNFVNYPWRRPEESWHALVAEILLQRTRASNVIPVYEMFVRRFPEPRDLASASEQQILEVIRPLGLAWRAPLLKKLGEALLQKGIPHSLDELLELPAVGPYVASAWTSFRAGGRAIIIDSNIVRFLCRLTGKHYNGETRRKRWVSELADTLTPRRNVGRFNYALLDFTMAVCTPLKPHCGSCPLQSKLCKYGSSAAPSN